VAAAGYRPAKEHVRPAKEHVRPAKEHVRPATLNAAEQKQRHSRTHGGGGGLGVGFTDRMVGWMENGGRRRRRGSKRSRETRALI
jgi:hypothetical protein